MVVDRLHNYNMYWIQGLYLAEANVALLKMAIRKLCLQIASFL